VATLTLQKALGAFYTREPVARAIVKWAVRHPDDSVLDPSCGDGVFLLSAARHLAHIGTVNPRVWGIDVNGEAFDTVKACLPECRLLTGDFFLTKPGDVPLCDVVIGNPPFIRYQAFSGSKRSAALARAAEAGVRLAELSSSWAPFLIHSTAFLAKGGRLGMVVPAELGHARYARDVLGFLLRKFRRIQFCIFRKKLFPELSEDTGLLFCEGFGDACTRFSVAVLDDIQEVEGQTYLERPVDIEAVQNGLTRVGHYLLSPKVRQLYEQLRQSSGVVRVGDGADVGIGYVSGYNDYFHLSLKERRGWRIPGSFLRPALLSLGAAEGVVFGRSDWEALAHAGEKVYLLAISPSSHKLFPQSVLRYLEHGVELGVPKRFKCRTRTPWYSVPQIRVADAFLSYMSGHVPRLVKNAFSLVAPNTLHLVRCGRRRRTSGFLAGWYSSLTRLSCELEGHALGGGMLKLEPSEAERVLVALPQSRREEGSLIRKLDALTRAEGNDAASDVTDHHVLRLGLGLSATECAVLRDGAAEMQRWRLHK
jgi:adenine-specific DNA-methyltransferase